MINTKEIITESYDETDESYWNELPNKDLVYVIPSDTNLSDFDAETDGIPMMEPENKDLDKLFKY